MKSPFPGMDPYIEASGLWEDFHNHLIDKICETLADAVPEHYFVRSGERSYLELLESGEKVSRHFKPDVSVARPRGRKKTLKKGGAALAEAVSDVEPVTMRAFVVEEFRETFVDIYESKPEQRLVTSLEVLSPSNKRPGSPGWDLYQRKRQGLLLGGVNLVEVDLLRGGQRMPMVDPWPDSAYTFLVARTWKAPLCAVWPVSLQRPLPAIPVPLASPDADIPLRLQPLIEAIYQRFRYGQSIDYTRPLTPPPGSAEAAWLEEQLRGLSG
jgi:hypothetical protein